jgi:hypothetical protein
MRGLSTCSLIHFLRDERPGTRFRSWPCAMHDTVLGRNPGIATRLIRCGARRHAAVAHSGRLDSSRDYRGSGLASALFVR